MRCILWGSLIAAALGVPAHAQDQTFACERDGIVRKVSVLATPDATNACEVHYQRASEGAPPQLLWHAQSDPDFCSAQAATLVSRLEQSGWSCNTQTATAAAIIAPAEPHSVAVALEAPSGVTASVSPRPQMPADAGDRAPVSPGAFKLRPTLH
jgi:hypothetical protein